MNSAMEALFFIYAYHSLCAQNPSALIIFILERCNTWGKKKKSINEKNKGHWFDFPPPKM